MELENHYGPEFPHALLDTSLENIDFILNKLPNQPQPLFESVYQELIHNLKLLRNFSAKGRDFQSYISSSQHLFDCFQLAWAIEHKMLTVLEYKHHFGIKTLLWQIMANICVNNDISQHIFWTKCRTVFLSSLNNEISSVTDVQLMILLNLSKSNIININDTFNLIIKVWSNYLEKQDENLNLEFLHIMFAEFLCSTNRITPLYGPLTTENRILVLKYIYEYIHNRNPNNCIQKSLMEYLSKEFKKKSDCILRVNVENLNDINPKEVIALLDVIAIATGDETYINVYCNDHSLFLNVGSLLQAINEIGRNADNQDNMFRPMENLNDIAPNANINRYFETEISYKLRTQLVRTLANLLYKNPKNQEYGREMKMMEAILNCTRMDARNPMIKEWSILAIRNLCKNCPENQEIITKLTKISDAPNEILGELDLQMGSLRIQPNV